jgi:hypothetical protein
MRISSSWRRRQVLRVNEEKRLGRQVAVGLLANEYLEEIAWNDDDGAFDTASETGFAWA